MICCVIFLGLSLNSPEFLKTVEMPVDQVCKRAKIQKNVQFELNQWN